MTSNGSWLAGPNIQTALDQNIFLNIFQQQSCSWETRSSNPITLNSNHGVDEPPPWEKKSQTNYGKHYFVNMGVFSNCQGCLFGSIWYIEGGCWTCFFIWQLSHLDLLSYIATKSQQSSLDVTKFSPTAGICANQLTHLKFITFIPQNGFIISQLYPTVHLETADPTLTIWRPHLQPWCAMK